VKRKEKTEGQGKEENRKGEKIKEEGKREEKIREGK
jgi:hypothetical protein